MRRSVQWTLILGVLLALTFGVAACGGDDEESGEQGTTEGTPAEGQKGGKLISLWAGDTDNIDPAITYYQGGTQIVRATQSPLYLPKIDDSTVLEPVLAESDPQVSEDGCTVTVTIEKGWKFSPPVDREVTSADVKYGIERGFFNSVNNGYAGPYFGSLKGAKVGADPGTKIPGIETPDPTTVVFNLQRAEGADRCAGGILAQALSMPLAAPVPEDYAKKFDAEKSSTYGQNQVSTGPYMIENDASGKAIGYQPGRRISFVRNPNWDASLDTRPAYVDEIEIQQGNDDATVMSRKILEGESLIDGDQSPPPAVLKQALERQEEQIVLTPSGGGRWVAMNTTIKPFDDINVRKAVVAGMDRNALLLTRGGKFVGDIATHFLPPGTAGFEEAGGAKGTGVDFISPDGKPLPEVSAKYFKAAGYASGKYEGTEKILMVGSNAGVAARTSEVVKQQLEQMGFQVTMRLVAPQTMYTRYCNVPKAKVAVCPNVGWIRDFADGQTMLSPTFAGKNILPQGNSNWPELDIPKINEAIDKAEIAPVEQRAQLWGEIDKMVTAEAPAIPWIWDKQALVQSKNVQGVIAAYNSQWDLAWTSLK